MSLLFMDSFDHYATADLLDKYTTSAGNGAIGAYGRNGTNGWRSTTGNHAAKIGCGTGTTTSGFMGFAMKTDLTTNEPFAGVCSAYNGCTDLILATYTDGSIHAKRANGTYFDLTDSFSTELGGSATGVIQAGSWQYIEFKWTIHDTLGAVTVRVNGIQVLALTNIDTRAITGGDGSWGSVVFGNNTAGATRDWDDLIVCDNLGSLNNDFLGDVTVTAIFPNGAGNSSGWTPSAGSNYENVDEAAPNDDTDYNATATVGAKDLYAFPNAPAGADIRAVQVLASVRKAAEGPGQVKLVTRSGGTDYDGTLKGIGGTSYVYVREVLETDPGSGSPLAAWTESGFNAAEFGIKKTA